MIQLKPRINARFKASAHRLLSPLALIMPCCSSFTTFFSVKTHSERQGFITRIHGSRYYLSQLNIVPQHPFFDRAAISCCPERLAKHNTDTDESSNFFDGYEDFISGLDLDERGWDRPGDRAGEDEGGSRSESSWGRSPRRAKGRLRGYDSGYGSNSHDYVRSPDDDFTETIDHEAIDSLLTARLAARKRRDFQKADSIRDELKFVHGVIIWDREKVWTTNPDSRGGSNRHRGKGRYAKEGRRHQLESDRDFGPNGHDYEQTGGPINPAICPLKEVEINALIAKRLRCKLSRSFREADELFIRLRDNGVFVHDSFKQWRADGEEWGKMGRKKKGLKKYRKRGQTKELTEEDVSVIHDLVEMRAVAKRCGNYDLADEIKGNLLDEFDVSIDDHSLEWFVKRNAYVQNSNSDSFPDGDESLVRLIEKKLLIRSIAKEKRDFETADAIRDELKDSFSIVIDDRLREWTVVGKKSEFDCPKIVAEGETNQILSGDNELTPQTSKNNYLAREDEDSQEIHLFDDTEKDDISHNQDESESLSRQDLESCTVAVLKEKLRAASLPVSGRKADLIDRLIGGAKP